MKADNVRKGMIFERVVRRLKKQPLPNGASVMKDQLFEVVEHERRELNGYLIDQVLMGNLMDRSGVMVEMSELCNPKEWRHHENALLFEEKRIVEISSRRVEFTNHDPIELEATQREIEPEEVGASTEKKIERALKQVEARTMDQRPRSNVVVINKEVVKAEPEPEVIDPDVQVVEQKDYSKYGSYTIDNLDLLVNSFMTPKIALKAKPKGNSLYVMAVETDWAAFADLKYTVREVREKSVRTTQSGGSGKLTFQRVLHRLMEGLVWFGTGKHKQALTDFLQRRAFEKQRGEEK